MREAAVFTHIPWPAFQEMDWRERARVVAHYRTHNLVESWQNWALQQNIGAGK
jgi:hypothetical protein